MKKEVYYCKNFLKNYFILLVIIVLYTTGCSKKIAEPIIALPFSEEKYSIEFTGAWTAPNFSIPAGAHFTNLVGMAHAKDTFMWKPNSFATPGLKGIAEFGYNTPMLTEMSAIVAVNKAKFTFNFYAPPITGSKTDTIIVNTNHSCVSFASMIAPSPDWFIGVNSVNCINNNQWVEEIVIPLYVYDAGTEEGDVFGYNNPATTPQQFISVLNTTNATVLANGNASLKPIAMVKFKRIKQ